MYCQQKREIIIKTCVTSSYSCDGWIITAHPSFASPSMADWTGCTGGWLYSDRLIDRATRLDHSHQRHFRLYDCVCLYGHIINRPSGKQSQCEAARMEAKLCRVRRSGARCRLSVPPGLRTRDRPGSPWDHPEITPGSPQDRPGITRRHSVTLPPVRPEPAELGWLDTGYSHHARNRCPSFRHPDRADWLSSSGSGSSRLGRAGATDLEQSSREPFRHALTHSTLVKSVSA